MWFGLPPIMAAGSKEECSKRGPGSGVMAIYDLALPLCHFYHTRLVKEVDTKICPGPRGGDLDSSSVQGCQVHSEKEQVGWERLLQLLWQNTICSIPAGMSPPGAGSLFRLFTAVSPTPRKFLSHSGCSAHQ